MAKGKPSIDNLDHYLARKEYEQAIAAIDEELRRRPDAVNLMLRKAEILVMAGDVASAVEVYRRLAEDYIAKGFYARAIAVANKMLRLDAKLVEITNQLATRISARQAADRVARDRLAQASTPAPEAAPDDAADMAGMAQERARASVSQAPPGAAKRGSRAAEPRPASARDQAAADEESSRERDASQFFAAFPPDALQALLAITTVRNFVDGDAIVREGEPGASLFLIAEGHVEVRTSDPGGRELTLAQLGPGDFFGEVSVLTGRPRTATIVARDAVTVIEIERSQLSTIIERHPEVDNVLRRFYERRAQATVEAMLGRLRGQGD